ncbi:hypothetical protein [Actinophytocola oryzae]|uniref:Uncharacterized protein n=1 Tax=Actinophytocola oryzae TaxID=502181 RepID=A0A4R7VNX5_9PSEU|nr:hypothetical protein [Actinophytocola oryzae]TDV51058.1 hypothetical protein CLV71_106409 [Actinophytocola oryzae]
MAAQAELVSDLKALRKGRGLYVNNVGERVGPKLRDLCGVTEQDGPGEIRLRVAQRLEHLAVELPDDLRMAALAAFGMIPAARRPLYQERVSWFAERIGRDPRTARRRIDDAIHQLAQLAFTPLRLRSGAEQAVGWHTLESRVILLLDGPMPEALETHRIMAAQDNLRELEVAPPFAQASVMYGGTLRNGVLVLASPLMAGQSCEFAIRSRNPVRPRQFLHMPRRRCDLLDLRVRFDTERLPRVVSRLQGRPVRERARVPIDNAGEIHVIFRDLTKGMPYGARWD